MCDGTPPDSLRICEFLPVEPFPGESGRGLRVLFWEWSVMHGPWFWGCSRTEFPPLTTDTRPAVHPRVIRSGQNGVFCVLSERLSGGWLEWNGFNLSPDNWLPNRISDNPANFP